MQAFCISLYNCERSRLRVLKASKLQPPNKLPEKTVFILLLSLFKRQKPETQNEELLEQQLTTCVPKYIQSIVRTQTHRFDCYLPDIIFLSLLSVPYWSLRYRYLADNCWTIVKNKVLSVLPRIHFLFPLLIFPPFAVQCHTFCFEDPAIYVHCPYVWLKICVDTSCKHQFSTLYHIKYSH